MFLSQIVYVMLPHTLDSSKQSKTKQKSINSLLSESKQEVKDITVCAYRLFMMVLFSSRRKNTPMVFMGEQEMVRLEVNYWKKVSRPSHTSWKNNLEHGHFISLGLDLLLAREPEAPVNRPDLSRSLSPRPEQSPKHASVAPLLVPLRSACLTLLPQLTSDEHWTEAGRK